MQIPAVQDENVSTSPPETSAPPRPRECSQHHPHTKPCGSPAYGHQQKDSGHPAATQKATKTARQKPTKNILIFFKKPIDKQKPLVYNNQARKQWLVGQAVKTLASHAENMGSIPVRVTKENRTPIGVLFSFFWCLVRHRTHPHERQDWHLYLVKPNPFQRTKRANWVRTPASPSRVETLWVRLIPVRVRTPIGVLLSFFWRLVRVGTPPKRVAFYFSQW